MSGYKPLLHIIPRLEIEGIETTPVTIMNVAKNPKTISEGNVSLKSFLEAASSKKLEFTGRITSKGNPLFTNGVTTLPIALGLLNYYINQNLIVVDENDNIICEKGWKPSEGTWTPKARAQQEL